LRRGFLELPVYTTVKSRRAPSEGAVAAWAPHPFTAVVYA
jgi:hypothetical protein